MFVGLFLGQVGQSGQFGQSFVQPARMSKPKVKVNKVFLFTAPP